MNDVKVSKEAAELDMAKEQLYTLEIGGPNNYYWKQNVNDVSKLKITPFNEKGKRFEDGTYTVQITPIYSMTDAQRDELLQLRASNDTEAITAFRERNNLPENVEVFNINFSIRDGQFVAPDQKEAKMNVPSLSSKWDIHHPDLYASINTTTLDYPALPMDRPDRTDAQVFADDVIVQGSLCVGFDCTTTESFGSDTQRLKENNLRIHFDDTSASASFPSNDWRILINDTTNGGASYFAVQDATSNRVPFRIEAGAIANALYVDDSGNVGFGTATPVIQVHVVNGNSPGLRLDQNGSSGFQSQIWDMAGNETNFFVRDVTNGSLLPFKIKPSAPTNSLFVDSDGQIGLGTQNVSEKLQIESGNLHVKAGNVGINTAPSANALDVVGNVLITGNPVIVGTTTFTGNMSAFLTATTSTFFSAASAPTPLQPVLALDAANTRVGIGTNAPGHLLELSADDAVKPGGGDWTAASDRRLKTNVKDFTDGLETLMAIRPVTFNYNGKLEMPKDQEFVGVIAQEVQEVAPYMVNSLGSQAEDGSDYLAFDGTPMKYVLINAVQEQQAQIEAQQKEIAELKSQLAAFQGLKETVAELAELVQKQDASEEAEAIGEKE
ncbi:MAG: tail fiber domain-containing protein [Bacteroidota bacterium]